MATIWQYSTGPEGWDRPSRGQCPDMTHLPVTTDVEQIDLLVSPFAGIGRMAGVQRQLASVRGVRRVRIGGLMEKTAHFVVTLDPGVSLATLVLANTVVVSASSSRLELSLKAGSAADRRNREPRRLQ